MRKYIFIFKSEIMSSLQYVSNVFINFIGYFIHIFIFINLWNYMYDDPTQLINGYSKTQTMWYIVITELIWTVIKARRLCRKIVQDVKGGNITYNMNKPYSYVSYIVSSHLGECTIRFIVYTILGITTGLIFMGNMPSLNIFKFIIVFISVIFAITIQILMTIAIGLLAFKIEDSLPIYWVYSKFILILGALFPIEFFPISLQGILRFTPVYVVAYGPAKLFVDFNYKNAIYILLAQIIYLALGYGLCTFIYRKGVKKLNVNGG